nr:cell division protein FtsX [Bacteroidota bacterium]
MPLIKNNTSMAESKDNILNRTIRSTYISSIISTSLVLFLLGMLGILLLQAYRVKNYVKENHLITIYLQPNLAEADVQAFLTELKQNEAVRTTKYISKEEAAANLQEEIGDDFVTFLGYNPLSACVDVYFKADYVDNSMIDHFKNVMKLKKQVKEVQAQQSLVEQINKNLESISLVVLIVSCILGFIAVILINNTIRLTLYSKRMIIRSMQLVGATKSFIYKPFLTKSIITGIISAIIAALLLLTFVVLLKKYYSDLIVVNDLQLWSTVVGGLILFGVLLSLICTFFAVGKWLDKPADKVF